MAKKLILVICALLLAIPGCQNSSTFSKEQVGTVTGAGIGGALGSLLGKGSNRTLWTVGGVVAGAWVGNRIGQYLDERDQQEMAAASQKAMITGQAQSWSNPKTKVSGTAEVVNTREESKPVQVPVLKDRVQKVPPLDLIGEPYRATAGTNVRGGPGTDYKVVETLRQGQEVDVIGQVQGQPWLMIGQNQVGSGFVFSKLLQLIPIDQRETTTPQAPADQGEIRQETVAATRTCRTVRQVVTLADGTEKEEKITACQGPNGWETVPNSTSG